MAVTVPICKKKSPPLDERASLCYNALWQKVLVTPSATLEVAPSRASIVIISQDFGFCQYARQYFEI